MAQPRVERKLAAIVAADVAGYSRLMGVDEAGAARRLREHQAAVTPIVSEHGGRIVNVTGDAMLMEYSSCIAAVESALAMQHLLARRNDDHPDASRMLFRMGINIGDVIIQGDDILGDGVNIAARLEALAEPGGICLSQAAYEQCKGKVTAELLDLGEQQLKNISEPVRVYAVPPQPASARTVAASPGSAPAAEVPRLSIVVLPFVNLGGDPKQDYFVDGITESLTTDLSRIPGALVVARNTAFSYRGRGFDVKRIGRELGVRYALEGSVQYGAERLRISVQLIDVQSGAQLWAERFDRELADLFKMQDEIVTRIARELDLELIVAEARRAERSPNLDSLDLFFRGWAVFNRVHAPAVVLEAESYFEQALALDPMNVDAIVGKAMAKYVFAATYATDDRASYLAAAEAAAKQALALAPNNARAHAALGYICTITNRAELGIAQAERAIALDPNLAPCHAGIGWAKVMLGRAEEAEPYIAYALRVSPRDSFAYGWYYMAGTAKLLLGREDEAIAWLHRGLEGNHDYPMAHFTLAAALALQGKLAEARAAAAAGLVLSPSFTIERYRKGVQSHNAVYLGQRERVYEGLRKAGVPEHAVSQAADPEHPQETASAAAPVPSPGIMLSPEEFAAALKGALRAYSRPDLLVGNPLLRLGLLAGREPAGPAELKALISEGVEALFANPRDEKLRRVIEVTYFRPAPKQEAAAERLGLPFGTYRRYLTTALERLAKWIRDRERQRPRVAQMVEAAAGGLDAPNLRARLSIVVLPFLNLSQDEQGDYLVDGIVDGLMTSLSRALPGSFVISRSTAFTYKGRKVPVRQIGQELRVRYVLEGSMLADPTRVRVNVQLIDARTEEHLWAERFDKERRDILEVQDEIVARLSRSVGIEMIRNEAVRGAPLGAAGRDAIDLVMRGQALATDIRRKENAAQAVSLFQQALALDPDNVEAMVGIAANRNWQVLNLYEAGERDALLDEAETLISRALALAPDHIGVLKARAVLLRARGRFLEAVVATRAVIALNPGEPTAYREIGLNKLYLGETREAADWFRRADSTAPRDLERWTWLQGLGRALLQMGQDAEAVEAFRLALDNNPNHTRGKALLAAAAALSGHFECAKQMMAEYAKADPGMTVRKFAEQRSSVPLDLVSPTYRRENERILEGLRRAGMSAG